MKIANVCFLIKDDQVLLAMKKRGFGVGKWNGVGGKVKEGESIEEATVREAKEEIGVEIDVRDLEKIAINEFNFPDKNEEGWGMIVHCFVTRKWKGEPEESEEMRPQWFKICHIPYDEMWIDDKYWLARALAGEKIKGQFYFVGAGESVGKYEVKIVKEF